MNKVCHNICWSAETFARQSRLFRVIYQQIPIHLNHTLLQEVQLSVGGVKKVLAMDTSNFIWQVLPPTACRRIPRVWSHVTVYAPTTPFCSKILFRNHFTDSKKTMWTTRFLAVTLVLLVLARDTEPWRRRRRRRAPPPCGARNCQVGSWSSWSACSHQCGTSGTQRRTRSKTVVEACGGTCPYPLDENRACNRDACKNSGTPHSSGCSCRPGYRGTCCESGKLKNARLITKTNSSVELTIALDSKMLLLYETN